MTRADKVLLRISWIRRLRILGLEGLSRRAMLGMLRRLTVLALLLLPALAWSQPPDRKFGGCNDALTLCAGPAASFSVVELNLSDDTSRAGLIPGIGYGVTFWPTAWYNAGASLFLEVVTGDGPDTLAPAFVLSFAEYLRLGLGFRRTSDAGQSETDTLFLLGLGADLGPTPGLGLVTP